MLLHDFETTLQSMNPEKLAASTVDLRPFVDLTNLDATSSVSQRMQLAQQALRHHVAAVCVLPQHLIDLPPLQTIQRATVINFPSGMEPPERVMQTLEQAMLDGADEIDYVFPYPLYLEGHTQRACSWCREVVVAAHAKQKTVKVILETGQIPSLKQLRDLAHDVIACGADFLKTSTGKTPIGATLPATFALLLAMRESTQPCGLKVSGGIRSESQARALMQLTEHMLGFPQTPNTFRFGCSSIDFLQHTNQGSTTCL